MPVTRIDYILEKQAQERFFPPTWEKTVAEKYLRKPIWDNPVFLAKKHLYNLNKAQQRVPNLPPIVERKLRAQIEIPSQVLLVLGKNNSILVTGVRGALIHTFDPDLVFERNGAVLVVTSTKESDTSAFSAQTGILYRMLVGVTRGYKEKLKTSGVGYRVVLEEKQLLTLFLGYSHRAYHRLLPEVTAQFGRKQNKINFSGPSWPAVSASAAEVHHLKKPDVYNGKGVRYRGLKLRKKEGKKQSR